MKYLRREKKDQQRKERTRGDNNEETYLNQMTFSLPKKKKTVSGKRKSKKRN